MDTSRVRWLGVLLLSASLLPASAQAEHYTVAATLRSPVPVADEYFGTSVGVAADVIAVGTNFDVGTVYVFDQATGALRYTLTPPPGRTKWFGSWLTGLGPYLVVGDSAITTFDPTPGALFIYDAASGTPIHTIVAPDGVSKIAQNIVPAGGNVLISGGPTAYLIDPATATVLQSFPTPYQSYGEPVVAADGAVVLVGSPGEAIGPLAIAGRARLYDAASGALLWTTTSPAPHANGHFGHSVALAGGFAVVREFDPAGGGTSDFLHVYDLATGAFVRTLGESASAVSWMVPLGTTFFFGNGVAPFVIYRVDPASDALLATISEPSLAPPYSLALLGDQLVAGDPYNDDDRGVVRIFDPCGNGVVTAGEECDDGNTASGDGCSAECFVELCGNAPEAGCRQAGAGRSTLAFKTALFRERFAWKWEGGAPAAVADFGTPDTTSSYAVCLYEGTESASPVLRSALRAPAGGTCGSRPCWTASPTGYAYADRLLTPSGLGKMKLLVPVPDTAKLAVQGKGHGLDVPGVPLTGRVTLQLRRTGAAAPCWEAHFSAPRRNGAGLYKARSD